MAAIDTAALLKTISALETQLSNLKGQLGGEVSAPKEKKKRAVNPDAKPNPWLEFLGRVRAVVKESKVEGPATIGVLFAKSLKDSNEGAYEMEAGAIADAFVAWATPENIEHAKSLKKAKKEKDEASESGSVAGASGADSEAEPKADKSKRVLSDEQKAKMKAGREAAKAKKDAAALGEKAAGAAGEAPAEEAPKEPVKGSGGGEGGKHAPPKKVAKKPAYTIEQLTDWNTLTYEGEEYGVNIRGDVINSDSDFAGHWDAAKKTLDRKAAKPADWDEFMA